ncbi:6-pyruvoyl tetrahydropterin synthase family protein [Streptomyces sp. NPDC003781]|uniref:6-pyruvoyl trahydropterin synthase family protein n=1 Tax=Streptomyces sp. NPDC003781 TaxID=3364686 RepID=UPI003688102C
MLFITKEFHFSASHQLAHLPPDHPCSRLHGHNYILVVELSCEDDETNRAGFVRDYRELDSLKKWVDEVLDHRHLNEVLPELNPSAENLARWIHGKWRSEFPDLTAVRVSETPKTWATYRPTA